MKQFKVKYNGKNYKVKANDSNEAIIKVVKNVRAKDDEELPVGMTKETKQISGGMAIIYKYKGFTLKFNRGLQVWCIYKGSKLIDMIDYTKRGTNASLFKEQVDKWEKIGLPK